ncbi:MAG: protein phosphatase [Myxococcota bacterium]|jgi:protein phosphatase
MTQLEIPQMSLVVLIGASSSGKTTLARRLFAPSEVISSDACRAMVSNDASSMEASSDAFDLVHRIADVRLRRGLLTVIDATSTTPEARKPLVSLAKRHHCLPVAIVLDPPKSELLARHAAREGRSFSAQIVRNHHRKVRGSMRRLKKEGFRFIHHLTTPQQAAEATLIRQPMWPDRRALTGPFDIIGDIHGCHDELRTLLGRLGWDLATLRHPEGRTAVFLGDLVDRGPDSPGVLKLVMDMVDAGGALCVPGNHEVKLLRALSGKTVRLTHGLERTMAQLEGADPAFLERTRSFIDGLISHLILDGGKLVVAHAGMKTGFMGRASARVRQFCLYGETSGETDEYGLPIRYDWASDYRGDALVVYGHTPVVEPRWVGRTICLDTGCAFGGMLTALRYPEQELISVPAIKVHYPSARPMGGVSSAEALPDLAELTGGTSVTTGLMKQVTVRAEHAAGALETMSRFAHDPRWLLYIPPTMSPCATAPEGSGVLERPEEALAYYRGQGVVEAVCQEKHMGSRAVVVACRSGEVAAERFGDASGRLGVVTTRTGRAFFTDATLEAAFIERIRAAMSASGLWDDSGVVVLDGELMPWSAKARELIRSQYAPVSAAGASALAATVAALSTARAAGAAVLLDRYTKRQDDIAHYTTAWQRYCGPVSGLSGLRFAPFHFLASGSTLHTDQDHVWHMETLAALAAADPELLMATRYRVVTLADAESCEAAAQWWRELTEAGGEGMVVKPRQWIVRGKRGLVQPAVKCRGPEYLRIIYGPSYMEQLAVLRRRSLGRKRSMALKELALGLEGLQRFVDGRPYRRVHACVFATLAMESEPVDPQL